MKAEVESEQEHNDDKDWQAQGDGLSVQNSNKMKLNEEDKSKPLVVIRSDFVVRGPGLIEEEKEGNNSLQSQAIRCDLRFEQSKRSDNSSQSNFAL